MKERDDPNKIGIFMILLGIALVAITLLLIGGSRGSARIGVLPVAGAIGIIIFTLGVAVYLLE